MKERVGIELIIFCRNNKHLIKLLHDMQQAVQTITGIPPRLRNVTGFTTNSEISELGCTGRIKGKKPSIIFIDEL